MIPARLRDNPFWVLSISPKATRVEIERAGQKLLGLMAIGAASARRYHTPLGEFERDESMVRAALSELRDPSRRLRAELWAEEVSDAAGDPTPLRPDGADVFAAIGWRGRWAE